MSLADYARRLNLAGGFHHLPPAILMTDDVRLPDPGPLLGALPSGAAVIYRNQDGAEWRDKVLKLKSLCRSRGLLLIVAGDPLRANDAGADGLHMSESAARLEGRGWAWKMRPGTLLTVAAHSPRAIRIAASLGADAVLLSPIYATASHPQSPALGILKFVHWARLAPLPVYALGGINRYNAARLGMSGGAGIAGIAGWGEAAPEDR